MCFSTPQAQANPAPSISDTTAASQLNLGTASVQQSSADVLGRLGLTNPKPKKTAAVPTTVDATNSASADLGIDPFYRTHPSTPPGP